MRSLKTEEEDSFQNKAVRLRSDRHRERGFETKSRSSAKGRTVDALASQGDEGRGKLRKAWGSGKHALIPGRPNGAIRRSKRPSLPVERIGRKGETRGSETSQYPEEKKSNNEIAQVAASERARAQTKELAPWGCGTATWQESLAGEALGKARQRGRTPRIRNRAEA